MEWVRSKNLETYKGQKYFREYFSGLKDSWRARSYLVFSYSRRAVIMLVIMLIPANVIVVVLLAWLTQVVYFGILLFLRPFEQTNHNAVDAVNETFFTVLLGLLLYFNKESRWREEVQRLFMYSILSNTLIIILITLGNDLLD